MGTSGIITNIQSYSLHDGPGTRIVVFLKGCPMRCQWCSNPETQNFQMELYYSNVRCMGCGICVRSCKHGALTVSNEGIHLNREKCVQCGECVNNCPTEAMTFSGKVIDSEELLEEVRKEQSYLFNSGGGVTFSGGEALSQPEFVQDTAKRLKEEGYHTAIETCFDVPYVNIEQCLPYLDLLLVDLKAVTPALHKQLTGRANNQILHNIKQVYGIVPLIFRIPVIPNMNGTGKELENMAEFIQNIDSHAKVNLIPYHSLGRVKYKNLGREYGLFQIPEPGKDDMKRAAELFLRRGLQTEIM